MRKKLSERQLREMIAEANEMIPPKSLWRHYKGGMYRVSCIAFDEETLDFEVVYQPTQYPEIHFTRTMVMWLETVRWQGAILPRFEKIASEPNNIAQK